MLEALGGFVYRRRWLILVLSFVFLAAAGALLARGGRLASGTIHGLESEQEAELAEAITGRPVETTLVVLFHATTDEPIDASITRALAPLRADPRVLHVVAPDDAGPVMGPRMRNAEARSAYALVTLAGDTVEATRAYPDVRREIADPALEVVCTGHVPFMSDLDCTLEKDLVRAELISMPLALLVLILVFRTVLAAALPVFVGGLAVTGGVALVLLLSRVTEIAQYTINICSLIGLGVAIDYSLFVVSRYREELHAGKSYEEALARAVGTAGKVVLFSGVAVGTGLSGLLFFSGSYLQAMGIGGAAVVLLAIVFALTFLPAVLAVLGPRIHALRVPFLKKEASESALWHRMATWVMRRPVRVLVPTLAVLLAMGIPFLHLKMTASDVRVLPADIEARRAYDDSPARVPRRRRHARRACGHLSYRACARRAARPRALRPRRSDGQDAGRAQGRGALRPRGAGVPRAVRTHDSIAAAALRGEDRGGQAPHRG